MARNLILAIDYQRVKMFRYKPGGRRGQIGAMLGFNVQLLKNLAEHLDCFRVRTHHQ